MKTSKQIKVLLIEDSYLDSEFLFELFTECLSQSNHKPYIDKAATHKEAFNLLCLNTFDIVVFDIDLDKRGAGLELLRQFAKDIPYPVISTSRQNKNIVKKGYELGCKHYINKPISEEKIESLIKDYLSNIDQLKIQKYIFDKFISQDVEVKEQLLKILNIENNSTHINGETGVGKQIVAELIHQLAGNENTKLHEFNCSAIENNLVEATLFGSKKGAFTGASEDRKGIFEVVSGGTLFLDEIDKTSLGFQEKLLKVLEKKEVTPLGSSKVIPVDFQLITASSKNIHELVESGQFSRDLWGRLSEEFIYIKPLRERPNDISLQIDFFMKSHKSGRLFSVDKEASQILNNYNWPNNTRELKNFVNQQQRRKITILKSHHVKAQQNRIIRQNYKLANVSIMRFVEKMDCQPQLIKFQKKLSSTPI